MYSIASESTEAVSVCEQKKRESIAINQSLFSWIEKQASLNIRLKKKNSIHIPHKFITFPKGETNCWSAVILSPIFSFLT